MATRQLDFKILNVVKTTAQWATWESDEITAGRTAVISKGLLCCETMSDDCIQIKIGDGVHKYSELGYITDHAIESLGSVLVIKGIVSSFDNLPSSGNHAGDVYFVGDSSASGSDVFEEYVWTTNNKWEFIGKTGEVVIPAYTGGTGISVADGQDSKVINHTNSVTAQSSTALLKISYDAQGHITGKASVTASDLIGTSGKPIIIDGTYNSSTNKVATQSTVSTAISNATTTDMTQTSKLPTAGTVASAISDAIGTVPTYTLSGAYGTGDDANKWITTLTPSSGSATTSKTPVASTSAYGLTKLSNVTNSTSTALAATANAVKTAYDLANGKSTVSVSSLKTSGLDIGTITIDGTDNTIKVPTGTTSSTVSAGNHTHTTTIAAGASGDTSQLSLTANTKYKITAGGTSYVFTTPQDTTYSDATTSTSGLMSSSDKTKLNGISSGAEVNQNAFSNIKVGSTTVAADAKTDTLELVADGIITITPDATNDKITISATGATVDSSFSTTSENALQNKVLTGAIDGFNASTISSTNKIATKSTVTSAINALDVPSTGTGAITGMGAGKTIATLTETDGKIAATFQNISVTMSQVSDLPTLGTAASANVASSLASGSSDLATAGQVYSGLSGKQATLTFDGTYNASTNKAATVSTVTNAINALDGNLNDTTAGAGKTLTAFSQTNGVVSATFGNISITKSQVSDFPTLGTAASKDTSTTISSGGTTVPTTGAIYTALGNRASLTFDSVPTDGSTNPVESNGVFDALATKIDINDTVTINCIL